ncbi:cation:dicarboxylase symporter family transporter [Microbispora sp. NPDC088329]|uniref:cation:dicarboxylate symporter family transporter n=1 Tax=Microbispora sp. NPDC088329 TaxID=3154869 RepID=UPI00343AD1FF
MSTSSSESALPGLMAKMEHLGVSRTVAGITVPTGYSFNLDGTATYLTMATLFVARATGFPRGMGEQIGLLVFMVIASEGAAGVTGAGLATLAAGLQAHRPALVDGVGLIVGIDRFMSEARALTNFAGNAVATVLIGTWVGDFDRSRAEEVLAGRAPFDEATFVDDASAAPAPEAPSTWPLRCPAGDRAAGGGGPARPGVARRAGPRRTRARAARPAGLRRLSVRTAGRPPDWTYVPRYS